MEQTNKQTIIKPKKKHRNKNGRYYFTGKLNLVFFFPYLDPEIVSKLFNLMYYQNLTPTLTPQIKPNPNRKPHIKCTRQNKAQCSFSLCKIFFPVK